MFCCSPHYYFSVRTIIIRKLFLKETEPKNPFTAMAKWFPLGYLPTNLCIVFLLTTIGRELRTWSCVQCKSGKGYIEQQSQQTITNLIIVIDDKSPNPYLMWSISWKHARSFWNPVCQHHISSFCMVVLETFLKPKRLSQMLTEFNISSTYSRFKKEIAFSTMMAGHFFLLLFQTLCAIRIANNQMQIPLIFSSRKNS